METGGVIVPIPYGEGVNGINMLDAGNDATGSREEGSTTGGIISVSFVYSETTGWGITGSRKWGGDRDTEKAFNSNEEAIQVYGDGELSAIEKRVYDYVTSVIWSTEDGQYNLYDFIEEFPTCYSRPNS